MKKLIITVIAVVMSMSSIAISEAEIGKRFKDVETTYKKMKAKYEEYKGVKSQENWLEMEQYRAQWRAARDYFDYPIRGIRERVASGKASASEKAEWRKWEEYDKQASKMEDFVENAPISLRPTKK